MKRSKFSEEQVVYALRQAEGGTPVGDLCRQLGVSDATFYAWQKKYAHLGVSELRRLRQLGACLSNGWRIATACSRQGTATRRSDGQQPPWPVSNERADGWLSSGFEGVILSHRPVSACCGHYRVNSTPQRPATGPAARTV